MSEVISGELLDPAGEPDPFDGLAGMLGMLGLPAGLLDALRPDPDAATLDDVQQAVDELRHTQEALVTGLRTLTELLAPVLAVCEALQANKAKLRKFGIEL